MRIISLAAVMLLATPIAAYAHTSPFEHELRQVREDIYVAVRPDVNRVPVTGNITFIINESDVIVVDSGGTPAAAEDAIRLLRSVTSLPVSTLINTHWHGDHHLGNSAWKDEWPDVEIIAHEKTHAAMVGEPMAYLETQSDEPMLEQRKLLMQQVEAGVDGSGAPLSQAEIQRRRDIIKTIPLMVEQNRLTRMVVPSTTFTESLSIERPGRRIDVLHLGRANTDGDAIVHLPDDGIVITGDVVVMPLPYGFYSYPSDWIHTLHGIKALEWNTLIPGHGEAQENADYLDTLITLLTMMREQVSAGVKAGKNLDDIRKELDFGDLPARLVGDDPVLPRLLQAYWVMPISKSAWKEATGIEIIQGVDPT